MKKTLTLLVLLGGFTIALVLLRSYSRIETYCFFCPSIDTQYAKGFSEYAFAAIRTNLEMQTVHEKLGSPLYIQTNNVGRVEWYYTLDGKCKWGDWAWLVRVVVFEDGRVIEVIKQIAYD